MTVSVRFAPSPTGYLHIGNLRPALFNWLFAQRNGGRFVLRYDDTDIERSRREYADAILEDIRWIGIQPDEIARESERIDLYDRAAAQLREAGLLYPCFETSEELEARRRRRLARGLPPIYGRESLKLSNEDRERLQAQGRHPHWRFRLPNFSTDPLQPERTEVHWDDAVRGRQTVDLASLSDPVLVREDGTYLYTLPSVVDDGQMGITHVLRGDDHITNTGVQIALFEALGYVIPTFGHFNLLTTIDGEGLSKRTGALSLRTLRSEGYEPMAIASLAVLTGMSGAIEAVPTLDALRDRLDFSGVSASSSKFDPAELKRLNAELVHGLSFTDVATSLMEWGVPEQDGETFWNAVRGNCTFVADAEIWARAVYAVGPSGADFSEDDQNFLRAAFDALPDQPFDNGIWKIWTDSVKAATGRKGKALFMPLRLALTGLDHGPELAELLPLIGRDRTLSRKP